MGFIYSPITFQYRSSNNNQVKVESGFFREGEPQENAKLEVRLHTLVNILLTNALESQSNEV